MKFSAISILVLLFTLYSNQIQAQKIKKSQVPTEIRNAFAQKFGTAKKVKWELENGTEYEANFKQNLKEYSAKFNVSGELLETEYEIKKKDLPAGVVATVKNTYKNAKFHEVEFIEYANASTAYEIEVKSEGKTYEVLLDKNGNILKSEEEKKGK